MVLTTLPMVQELSAARHWKPDDVPPSSAVTQADRPKNDSSPLISEVSTKIISEKRDTKTQPNFLLRKLTGEDDLDELVAEVELPSTASYHGHGNKLLQAR